MHSGNLFNFLESVINALFIWKFNCSRKTN